MLTKRTLSCGVYSNISVVAACGEEGTVVTEAHCKHFAGDITDGVAMHKATRHDGNKFANVEARIAV